MLQETLQLQRAGGRTPSTRKVIGTIGGLPLASYSAQLTAASVH